MNRHKQFWCYAGVGFGDHCAFIYTAEMAPPRWRGRLNTIVQLGTISGIVVANAINIGTNKLIWGWRLSLGLAAVPGAVLLAGRSTMLTSHPVVTSLKHVCLYTIGAALIQPAI